MSRNKDVFQVLVTSGDQGVLAAGNTFSDLAIGQIGAFDANTNLSVDGSAPVREFYLAIGRDRDGDTVVDSLDKSAGQLIQRANIRDYSFRPHTPGAPMIAEISGYKANCDTDYAVKLEFRNQQIYRNQGFVQFTHTYAIRTSCCEGCESCPTGDCNEITKLMVAEMNLDTKGLVSAEAIAASALTIATHGVAADLAIGDVLAEGDLEALMAFNALQADDTTKVCTSIRITTNPLAVNNFCSVNLSYFNPRGTVILGSLVEGFDCNGVFTVTQDVVFEEGAGYDIQQREYKAGGFNGRPGVYRQSSVTGMAFDGFEYNAVKGTNYDVFSLTYDQFSVSGWQEHLNNLNTSIAIPAADSTTRAAFATLMDGLMPEGFDALADDAAAAVASETTVEKTEDKTEATDGLA